MATLSRTPSAQLAPKGEQGRAVRRASPPHVLRCLVVSASAERRRLIRTAAEAQAWDAIVCRDAGEFLRCIFKRSAPLAVVDLPGQASPSYGELCSVAERVKQVTESLLLVAGSGSEAEEIWARSMGAWGYLNEAVSQRGFEFVLDEARNAIARNAVAFASPFEGDRGP
jgi:DNA-binding response OmpR family regulator